ncbi:AIPR family protein [Methylobacterium sp. Leaf89]|uniref:AIPR family protein n=1 Tax=Methylobacterium sp. Leaf89 TaxID=1736245 RepID=UPI0009E667D1|nr:AIPR family protein [Methylobacterium sp. Leaf89]
MFPLFHNGITIIAKSIFLEKDSLSIEEYYVINGCQSLTSLHENKDAITDELRVLAKFISMDPASPKARLITEYSNNQNGVRSRDFKSNSSIQIRLQNEFNQNYKGLFSYEIKRGETSISGEPISNEEAGLYLMAFDHKEPWRTHYKYEVFEDKHSALFGRPEVTADRIVLLRVIDNEIKSQLGNLKEQLLAKYKLTRFMIIYIIQEMLSDDETFQKIVARPQDYMRNQSSRERFRLVISGFVANIIIDINVESDDFDENFDYRRKIKDDEWVKNLTRNMEKDFKKNVARKKQDTFATEWALLESK